MVPDFVEGSALGRRHRDGDAHLDAIIKERMDAAAKMLQVPNTGLTITNKRGGGIVVSWGDERADYVLGAIVGSGLTQGVITRAPAPPKDGRIVMADRTDLAAALTAFLTNSRWNTGGDKPRLSGWAK